MADLVLGIASSHTPQMSSGPEWWSRHAERDRHNPELVDREGRVVSFEALCRKVGGALDGELKPDVWRDKFDRAQRAVEVLAGRLRDAEPEAVVVVGDDQQELFGGDVVPAVAVYTGDVVWDGGADPERRRRTPEDILAAEWAQHADEPDPYPVATELAGHLARVLVGEGFDLAVCRSQGEGRTLGHAFTFVRRRLGLPPATPIVPVLLNTIYGPNVPTPSRCIALGGSIRRAIGSWGADRRVAVMASGGLSHFVIDEVLDRRILDALLASRVRSLADLPARHFRSGTSESLNWLVVGGSLDGLAMDLVDYIPAYRSEAGTGTAMAFATWS